MSARLAGLHAQAFDQPWPAEEIAALVAAGAEAIEEAGGFILIRAVADEAEILTLAVEPAARRQGLGRRLVDAAVEAARSRGAGILFLEVAADNDAAIALYRSAGFHQTGVRPKYYRRAGMQMQDALIFARTLNSG